LVVDEQPLPLPQSFIDSTPLRQGKFRFVFYTERIRIHNDPGVSEAEHLYVQVAVVLGFYGVDREDAAGDVSVIFIGFADKAAVCSHEVFSHVMIETRARPIGK